VGRGFHARERVRVVVHAGAIVRTRSVVAGPAGGFVVSFRQGAGGDPCQASLEVSAVGARGDRAEAKLVPRECPPAL
jgi:hypothetical protein